MELINKVKKYFCDDGARMVYLSDHGFYRRMPDKEYLQRLFKLKMGYELNLENPKTFNEKLQWLKLYDRRPEYTTMVDKYAVKQWVADRIGEEHVIPTLGVWDHFDDIDFDDLPDRFVLKCTHDSGSVVVVKDKAALDKMVARKKLERSLKKNFYWIGREWPYKDVPPRIIAEKYMVDESGTELKDYKVFNFDGEPKIIEVDFDRFVKHKRNLYSTDWKYIEAAIQYPTDSDRVFNKPKSLKEMLGMAKMLAKDMPHLRTDFYCIGNQVYFGELTFFHEAGFGKFAPASFDAEMGEWIELPGGGYLLKNSGFALYLHERDQTEELADYKLMCFNGVVKCAFVCSERFTPSGLKVTFYDTDWNIMPFERHYPKSEQPFDKPITYDEMVMLAEELAKDIPFARVDFYEVCGKSYFGEITLYPGSGMEEFTPSKWDETLGEWTKLPGGGIS